jgi:hypothetical protein
MGEPLHPATPHALPRDLAAQASELFGREHIVRWCEELLAGRVRVDDPSWPDISWLGGTVGWPDYWGRVWGARGLLHAGPPMHPSIVMRSLTDESWRVREMSLKVVRRHGLEDPDGVIERLVHDPVERVRVQAWTTLGRSPDARSARHPESGELDALDRGRSGL